MQKETLKQRNFILNGNLYKVIIKLSLPLMAANLMQTIYNLTDTYFVSRIGDITVTAVGTVWPIIFFMMAIGMGVSMGAKTLISQYLGAEDNRSATAVAGQIISFAAILSIILGVAGIIVAPTILHLIGAEGLVAEYGLNYLNIILAGSPFMFLFFSFQTIRQAEGDMVTPMIFSGISIVINIALDPLFIFTFNMGVEGAAYATILSRLVGCIIAYGTLIYGKNEKLKPRLKDLIPDFKIIKKTLKIGIPASVGQMTTSVGFMVLIKFILSYGVDVMTAYTIGNRIISLILMPCFGIGSSLSTIVGQTVGAGMIGKVKEILKKALIITVLASIFGIIILYPLRTFAISIFSDTESVIYHGVNYIQIMIIGLPLMGIFSVFNGIFYGTGKSTYAMITMLARLWIFRLPVIALLMYVFKMNEYAIWAPMFGSNILVCILCYWLYKKGNWQSGIVVGKGLK